MPESEEHHECFIPGCKRGEEVLVCCGDLNSVWYHSGRLLLGDSRHFFQWNRHLGKTQGMNICIIIYLSWFSHTRVKTSLLRVHNRLQQVHMSSTPHQDRRTRVYVLSIETSTLYFLELFLSSSSALCLL